MRELIWDWLNLDRWVSCEPNVSLRNVEYDHTSACVPWCERAHQVTILRYEWCGSNELKVYFTAPNSKREEGERGTMNQGTIRQARKWEMKKKRNFAL